MSRIKLVVPLVGLQLAVLLVPSSGALASAPQTATATVYNSLVSLQSTQRGASANTLITATLTTVSTGFIQGTGTETITAEVHPDGSQTTQVWGTGTATVLGQTGQIVIRTVGSGTPTALSGHLEIRGISGGLTGFQAQGTFTGNYAESNVTIQYHWSP